VTGGNDNRLSVHDERTSSRSGDLFAGWTHQLHSNYVSSGFKAARLRARALPVTAFV